MTGANEDFSHPKTDAWDNLRFAFESAKSDNPEGVYVAFHDRLIPADLVVKEPFNGSEMNYVASNDETYIEGRRRSDEEEHQLISKLAKALPDSGIAGQALEYAVNVVRPNHNQFLARLDGVHAILLILYHSGTANTEKDRISVARLVKQLREQRNIIFFGVTENGEPVNLHSYETSVKLREAGVVPLYNMRRAPAMKKLQKLAGRNNAEIIEGMLKNMVGEIDESQIISDDINQLKQLYTQSA